MGFCDYINRRRKRLNMGKEARIAVLVPAYNPDEKMIDFVNELDKDFEHIVVVNDGCDSSFDKIFDAVKDKVTLLKHEVNKGKGRALKTGLGYVKDNLGDLLGVVTVDADGQHTPEDTKKCCAKFIETDCKPVFGCRDFKSDTKIPPRSRFGNRLTSHLLKHFCDIKLSDTQTGLRVLPVSSLADMLEVKGERYEYEMNMIFALKNLGLGWSECPISVIYIDDNESSHFDPIKDSMRIYKVFLGYFAVALVAFILDIVLFTMFVPYFDGILPNDAVIGSIVIGTFVARICSGLFKLICSLAVNGKRVASYGIRHSIVWVALMVLSAGFVNAIKIALPAINTTVIKVIVDFLLSLVGGNFR